MLPEAFQILREKIKKDAYLKYDYFLEDFLKDWPSTTTGYSLFCEETLTNEGIKYTTFSKWKISSKLKLASRWKTLSEDGKTDFNLKVRDREIQKFINRLIAHFEGSEEEGVSLEQCDIIKSILKDDYFHHRMRISETKNMNNQELCDRLYYSSQSGVPLLSMTEYMGLGRDLDKNKPLKGFKSEEHINFYRMNELDWYLGCGVESAGEICGEGESFFPEFGLDLEGYCEEMYFNSLRAGQLDLVVSNTPMILVWDWENHNREEIKLEAPVTIRELLSTMNLLYSPIEETDENSPHKFVGLVEISPGRFKPSFCWGSGFSDDLCSG